MSGVSCIQCRREVPDDVPNVPRQPCPACGSTGRTFAREGHEHTSFSDHVSALQAHDGSAIRFGESERGGTAASAEIKETDRLAFQISGRSPQGEDDTFATSMMLIAALNARGAQWGAPKTGASDVDREAVDEAGKLRPLRIQVVRAVVSNDLWRKLGDTGHASGELSITDAAKQLHEAIEKKAKVISQMQRTDLVLALDANRLPGHAFHAVIEAFRRDYGTSTIALGFRGVFVVGPVAELVFRVDGDEAIDG